MAGKCKFSSAEAPSCELSALPGKPFCSRHLTISGTIEEMNQVNATGLTSKQVLNRAPEDPETAALKGPALPDLAPRQEPTPPRPAVDPEVLGSQMAELLVQAEMEDRVRRFGVATGGAYRAEGSNRKVPFKVAPRRLRPDSTAMLDEQGESLLPRGWVGRWVRQQDHLGRPTVARVEEFKDYDYQPVLDKNGKQLTSHLGVAMCAPPQQYALRVMEKAPLGGVTRDTLLEGAEQVVRSGNQQVGCKAAAVYVGDEHGTERRIHEATT